MADAQRSRRGIVGGYQWEQDASDPSRFRITRVSSGSGVEIWGYTSEQAEAACRGYDERERAAREALESDDPRDLCALGWHRRRVNDGVPFDSSQIFFRFRAGKIGGQLRWGVASEPVELDMTTITGIGPQAVPWGCAQCDGLVPAPRA